MTFEDWIGLTDEQRQEVSSRWNPYAGEGDEIVAAVAEQFKRRFAPRPDVDVGHGVYHGGDWIIRVTMPLVSDKRGLPDTFLGVTVRRFTKDLPPEFQIRDPRAEYVWAPERYELFVDRAADEIREKLGRPSMTRKEMLDALCGEDFDAFKARCEQWEKERKIPPFRRGDS